jgi:ubiquinone/menaquinone biosynthesis C-methylase UbiE
MHMAWYDVFSRVYDASIEPHYRVQRAAAVEALGPSTGATVLDFPCGTGQSFAGLAAAVGGQGRVLGGDRSYGMLREASRRVEQAGWRNVEPLRLDVLQLSPEGLGRTAGATGGRLEVDRLHVFLGLSVFPDWTQAFQRLWSVLAPGGRCAIVDVHAETLGLQGHLVNLTARADIRRRFWEPLESVAKDFERQELPSKPLHGGQIFLVTARK